MPRPEPWSSEPHLHRQWEKDAMVEEAVGGIVKGPWMWLRGVLKLGNSVVVVYKESETIPFE
jgi:hypothetical protein